MIVEIVDIKDIEGIFHTCDKGCGQDFQGIGVVQLLCEDCENGLGLKP